MSKKQNKCIVTIKDGYYSAPIIQTPSSVIEASENIMDITLPIVSKEDEDRIDDLYKNFKELNNTPIDNTVKEVIKGQLSAYRPNDPWIQTYTGRRFNPTNPVMESIAIEDIAHALSQICRYTGHSFKFYSVAEHSVLVSYLGDPKYGLLHDASESYICDIASPIKKSSEFKEYRNIEYILQSTIYKKFGLSNILPESTKKADLLMLSTEAHYLMRAREEWAFDYEPLPFIPKCLPPEEAEDLFLKRYYELFK